MSNSFRFYLAGMCHGVGALWIAGYLLYKADTPLAALFNPRDGLLPVTLAILPILGGGTLIQLAMRWRNVKTTDKSPK